MYHIFFIHSSVDGHCLYVLTFVNSTAMNIRVSLFFGFFRAAPVALEVPGLGVELELQPLAYTTATVTRDPTTDHSNSGFLTH